MTEPTGKNPAKRLVIGCLLLFILGGVLPAVVFVVLMTGFLHSHGIGAPDEEAIELAAKYGEMAQTLVEQADADAARVREAGAAARAALPPDAMISADWDVQVEMRKAWREVDEETLHPLVHFLTCPVHKLEDTMDDLREHLKPLREPGKLTVLEDRFDPNVHSNEGVLESFKDFVLELKVLDEMEAAIDYGVWPMSLENPGTIEDYDDRFGLGRRLLCRRGIVLAERGETDKAIATCVRMCKLHAAMIEDPASDLYHGTGVLCSAVAVLERLPRNIEDDTLLTETLAQCLALLPPKEAYVARLDTEAVGVVREFDMDNPLPSFMRGDEQKRLYRAVAQAEAFTELLQNPTEENEAEAEAISNRFEMAFGDGSEDAVPSVRDIANIYTGEMMGDLASEMDTFELERDYEGIGLALMYGDAIKVAVALATYKAATGAYPESLDALVPDPFDAVPRHAITGKPYLYERDGGGYELKTPPATPDEGEEEDEPASLWKMER